jgi:PII-like signaling protein
VKGTTTGANPSTCTYYTSSSKGGLKGATVYQGIAGYGSHSLIHHVDLLRLSEDLPIVVEVVDTEDSIMKVLPEVKELVKEGLITLEKVQVVFYGHKG